jgi:hypothetical protein
VEGRKVSNLTERFVIDNVYKTYSQFIVNVPRLTTYSHHRGTTSEFRIWIDTVRRRGKKSTDKEWGAAYLMEIQYVRKLE